MRVLTRPIMTMTVTPVGCRPNVSRLWQPLISGLVILLMLTPCRLTLSRKGTRRSERKIFLCRCYRCLIRLVGLMMNWLSRNFGLILVKLRLLPVGRKFRDVNLLNGLFVL